MGIINAGIRKGIKAMAVVAQTAQFVSLMPKPKDFVTRIVGDVVYLSSRVIKLSDDLNRLLDSYTEIPTNYLMTDLNSITGSLTGITDRLNMSLCKSSSHSLLHNLKLVRWRFPPWSPQ